MSSSDKATFSINLETNSGQVSAEAAAELEGLRQKIHGSNDAVKQMSASLRSLRGSSDEVKAAKAQLRAMVESERNAISASNLALLKNGTTYEKLAGHARKAAAALKTDALQRAKADTDSMGNALKAAGGPVAALRARFESLNGIIGGTGGGMGALTLALAGTVAAVAALVGGLIAGGVALVKFIITGADAARTLQLVREAFTGNAQSATSLGTQVDALAGKVATSKEALNELGVSLTRTRLSGQAIVDTFNLVGQASAAMGDQVGKQLEDIVTRGQISKRLQINPQELVGTGISFKGVAAELAEQMHIGVADAQAALFEGRVKLEDGAKALRKAVEKRFGEINARKLLTLDVQAQKFKERLGALTAGVNLEPLLKGLDEISKLFDASTVSGDALKKLITIIGDGLGPAFKAVMPIAKGWIKGMIIGALDVGIAFLTLRNQFRATFGDKEALGGIDLMTTSVKIFKGPLDGIALALDRITYALHGIDAVKDLWARLTEGAKGAWASITNIDWKALGLSIPMGIVDGLKSGATFLREAVTGLANTVKGAFAGNRGLKIQSPSKVFVEYGRNTAQGFEDGVSAGAPSAAQAADALAPGAPAQASGAARGGGAGVVLNLSINVSGGGGGEDVAKQLSEPSFLAKLTKAVTEVMVGAGVPTQATVSA